MSNDNDLDYYASRERQARELADSASDPSIKSIHLQMADRYAEMRRDAASANARRTRPTPSVGPSGGRRAAGRSREVVDQ